MVLNWNKRLTHLWSVFLLIPVTLLLLASCQEDNVPPKIVILYIDDMDFGDPSCFGNPDMKTPCIDRLASEGVMMTNFYTNSPICSTSRVALNTGQYPARHQVFGYFASKALNRKRGMVDYLDPDVMTIAKVLKSR